MANDLDLHKLAGDVPVPSDPPSTAVADAGSFVDVLYQELVRVEGLKGSDSARQFETYYDSEGKPTIGVGFNLHVSNVLDFVLNDLGLIKDNRELEPADRLIENGYITQVSNLVSGSGSATGNLALEDALQAIMTTRSQQPYFDDLEIQTTKFGWDDDADMRQSFSRFLSYIDKSASGKRTTTVAGLYELSRNLNIQPSAELVALYSMFHNAKTLVGPHLQGDILKQNRAEAWCEIRYASSRGTYVFTPNDSLQGNDFRRRVFEAQIFDLYGNTADPKGKGGADPNTLKGPEVFPIWRMFTRHSVDLGPTDPSIRNFELANPTLVGASNARYGDWSGYHVQTWAQAFDPAWQYLKSTYGGDLRFNEHGAQPFDANDDESHVWAAPDNADGSKHTGLWSVASAPGAPTAPAHYFLIGGDGTVVARSGDNPVAGSDVSIIDGGTGHDTVTYSNDATTTRVATVELVPANLFVENAPLARVEVDSSVNGIVVHDLDYAFQNLVLGGASVVFRYDGKFTAGLDSVDAGRSLSQQARKSLDLSGYSRSLSIKGPVVIDGIKFQNFNRFIGTDFGDTIKGTTDLKEYDLGNGNNYVADLSGPDLTQSGPDSSMMVADLSGTVVPTRNGSDGNTSRNHWVLVDLGTGSSTVDGGLAPASEVYAGAGHVGDVIEISPDTRLHGLNPTDKLTWGGVTITGGVHFVGSEDSWAYGEGGLIRFNKNTKGDLLIQTEASRIAAKEGWSSGDASTYIAGYQNGDAHGNANATAHVYVIDVTITATRLLDILQGRAHLAPGALMDSWGVSLGNMCKAYFGVSYWKGVDPLVVSLGRSAVATTALETDAPERFDINGDGFATPTGWIGADEGFLVHLDASPDGGVTSVKQLFGSAAVDGFKQLAALDSNGDGVIDASDAGWSTLRVWQDANGNHQLDTGELLSMDQAGIRSISLAVTPLAHSFDQGNQVRATTVLNRVIGPKVWPEQWLWVAQQQLPRHQLGRVRQLARSGIGHPTSTSSPAPPPPPAPPPAAPRPLPCRIRPPTRGTVGTSSAARAAA